MLSAVPHAFWSYVLKQVRVLFNSSSSSLTDAFCIAILEAASCGLLTVRTRVGEVLPDDKILLAEPDPSDMVRSNGKAISLLPNIDPQLTHNRVSEPFIQWRISRRCLNLHFPIINMKK
ncbi:hypothetical protein Peur_007867 [Populus x canadensis]